MSSKYMSRLSFGLTIGLGCALGTMALADDLGSAFMDTGTPVTDDTGSSGPGDTGTGDTGTTTDDTGTTTDDTGTTDDTSSPTDDTGSSENDTAADDTGTSNVGDSGLGIGMSAAELAGEKGGCSCATVSGGAAFAGLLPLLALVGLRRRR